MDRLPSILVSLVALGLMGRWGVRSARLRAAHGPPPQGVIRRIYVGVTAGYVLAGGALVWWLLGDLIQPGWVQLLVSEAASIGAFRVGALLEAKGRVPRRRVPAKTVEERVDRGPADG